MSISNVFFTKQGKVLQAKCMAGKTLHFTKLEIGDGELGSRVPQELKSLVSPKLEMPLTKFLTLEEGKVKIGGKFNNSNLEAGFYLRELGLYAQDPDTLDEVLYCYGNAGNLAEYISSQGSEIIEKQIDIIALVGNKANVTATINSSLLVVTPEELEAHNQDENAPTSIREWVLKLFNGLKLTWDNITGKPETFPAAPHGHSSGEITGLPTTLPANGGNADTVDGYHASSFAMSSHNHSGTYLPNPSAGSVSEMGQYIDLHKSGSNADYDGRIYVNTSNQIVHTDKDGSLAVNYEINNLKSTVVNGKTSVANAINDKLGTALSNQTSFADLAYYIGRIVSINSISLDLVTYTRWWLNSYDGTQEYTIPAQKLLTALYTDTATNIDDWKISISALDSPIYYRMENATSMSTVNQGVTTSEFTPSVSRVYIYNPNGSRIKITLRVTTSSMRYMYLSHILKLT